MSRNQIRIEFTSKTPFAGGVSFGNTGPYERLLGMASFAIDPNEKDLPFVVDLDLAPRNAEGLVEFKAVLDIVKPVNLNRGNRRLLFDFSNRGNRGAFTRLNDGGGSDLSKESYAGNGFLMRQGYTIVWCGWQGDLLPQENWLVTGVPVATNNGKEIVSKVRTEIVVEKKGIKSQPLSGDERVKSYRAASLNKSLATPHRPKKGLWSARSHHRIRMGIRRIRQGRTEGQGNSSPERTGSLSSLRLQTRSHL